MYPAIHAAGTPDKAAVIMAGSGRCVTYRELDDESRRLAWAFREAGLVRGDRIAVLMGNAPRYLTVCWAAQRSGLVYVPLNWHLTDPELSYILSDSAAKVLIADSIRPDQAVSLSRGATALRLSVAVDTNLDGFVDYESLLARQPSETLPGEMEGGDLIYSSGTTGRPKGGVRPLLDLHPAQYPPEYLAGFAGLFGIGPDSRFLTPGAPLYHAAPLRFAMSVTRFGATNVIMEEFDAAGALDAIETHRVTHSQWVPTMFVRLLRLEEQQRSSRQLSSHQVAIHSSAPCPPTVKQQMIDWWGPILHEYYGGSEGGGLTHLTSPEWLSHRGSVGRATIGTIHILDEGGQELPAGEVGVIYTQDGAPVEYLNDPDKTRDAHDVHGWVTVGDMGYLDEEGYLYLTDRRDHMIISGGVNIYPQEIEDVLIQHPAVSDVAVIGVPNEDFGEEVKAVVELVDPTDALPDLEQELIAFCRVSLAGYKCPRSVDFEPHLPRAPTGKLYKRRLRERYWRGRQSNLI